MKYKIKDYPEKKESTKYLALIPASYNNGDIWLVVYNENGDEEDRLLTITHDGILIRHDLTTNREDFSTNEFGQIKLLKDDEDSLT